MRGKTYAYFKTAHYVEYHGSMLMDFHETSMNRIVLMRWWKWGATATMLISNLHILLNIVAPCWWIFMRLLWQGFFWWHDQNKGQQPYAYFKTACFIKYFSSMLIDFHKTSITGIFDETIDMRGNNNMLTPKLHLLLNISIPCWQILMWLLNRDSFDEKIWMWGNHPMQTSKLHVLLNISAPCWQILIRIQ